METLPWIFLALLVAIGIPSLITLWVILMSKPSADKAQDVAGLANRRADGSNKISTKDMVASALLSVVGLWLSWRFFKDERAVFTLSRHANTVIEVSGRFSSILGSLAMLTVASSSLSVLVDHFDRRPNEHKYKAFLKYCSIGFLAFSALAILAGWAMEHIRLVSK